jgi:hypothetical protein
VVGAYKNDEPDDSGSAYVFTKVDGGEWSNPPTQEKLTASDAASDDRFGISVAISGDTIVVGAYYDDDVPDNSGSAYIFTKDAGEWSNSTQQKLTASDAADGDNFGKYVAIEGDTIVVGAAYGDDDDGAISGSAYVFTKEGNDWSEQQKLTASDAASGDRFGKSVAISGDTIVVGAYRDDTLELDTNSGSAYIFTLDDGEWLEQEKITASDAATDDDFGRSVAIDTTVVGDTTTTTIAVGTNGGEFAGVFEKSVTVASASSSGDPYVTPFQGPQFKLPNREACYRLFEGVDVFINASVAQADATKGQSMVDYYRNTATAPDGTLAIPADRLVTDGYFYDSLFLCSEGNALLVDLENRTVRASTEGYFAVCATNNNNNSHFGTAPKSEYEVAWSHPRLGEMAFRIAFYDNPQIDNGLSLSFRAVQSEACVGLLMRNYRPRLMEVPSISTLGHPKLQRRLLKSRRTLFQKTIVAANEEWFSGDFSGGSVNRDR